jgi:hypothetical protein
MTRDVTKISCPLFVTVYTGRDVTVLILFSVV